LVYLIESTRDQQKINGMNSLIRLYDELNTHFNYHDLDVLRIIIETPYRFII